MKKFNLIVWVLIIGLLSSGFTCSKHTPRELQQREQESNKLDERTDKIKRLTRGLENFGLHKYEDAEVVCYIARQTESVALQCFPKGSN